MKVTYVATAPDGSTHSSWPTTRTYTHAVLARIEFEDGTAEWVSVGFSGREELAAKKAAAVPLYGWRNPGGWYTRRHRRTEVLVVPVTPKLELTR